MLYQAFIPQDVVAGPSDDLVAWTRGDNRSFDYVLGSSKAFQEISLSIVGLVLPIEQGLQGAGVTPQYAADGLDTKLSYILPAP